MPTFGEKPALTRELVREILRREYVTTFEDLVQRRLSLVEAPGALTDVMGLPVAELRALFTAP
jgi:hypothetical protein